MFLLYMYVLLIIYCNVVVVVVVVVVMPVVFLNQARAWFLEIVFVKTSVCVCVRPPGY